jgi:ubiquinone/menaquinone biosynthesis C-methylase UbiE
MSRRADNLNFAKDATFDAATMVLAIQNIKNVAGVFAEAKRVLESRGEARAGADAPGVSHSTAFELGL